MMFTKAQSKGMFMVIVGGAIAVTIFSLLFIYAFRSAQESIPALTFNESKYQQFNQTNKIINLTTQMNNAFTGNSSGNVVGDIITVTTTGGYNTIQILGAVPSVYSDMMYSAANILGIPREIVSLITFIVLLAVIALFILLVFRVYIQ